MAESPIQVKPGQVVYDGDGQELGVVQGFTEEGFAVSTHEGVSGLSLEHEPGHAFGEGYLVWRCAVCGAVGELDEGSPGTCPDCGAAGEELYAWLED